MSDKKVNITQVRGKEYLEATEINKLFWERFGENQVRITSEILEVNDQYAIVKSTVEVFNLGGELDRCADGIKSAFRSEFPSYIEKAQTGSIKRAMEFLGVNLGSLDGEGEGRERQVQSGWQSKRPSQSNDSGKPATAKASNLKIEQITVLIRKRGMSKAEVDEMLKKFSGAKELSDLTAGQASALEHKLLEMPPK